jgi:hypothetical protein
MPDMIRLCRPILDPRRRRPGNRHAELMILCARIGFNP